MVLFEQINILGVHRENKCELVSVEMFVFVSQAKLKKNQ